MNDHEWNELQRLWKSSPPHAEPVAAELTRLGRGRRWVAVGIIIETIIALAGLSAAGWMLTRSGAFFAVTGIATCVFVAAACVLSLWARRAPRPKPDEAVSRAVAIARQHAFASVRLAAATIWALVTGLVFAAVMALARGLLTTDASLGGYVALGAVQLMLAAWLAFAFRYYQTRSAALAKLDAIAADLQK